MIVMTDSKTSAMYHEDMLSSDELTLVDNACDAVDNLSKLVDSLADRSLNCYCPHTDYFDNIKYQCKKIVAGLEKLEDRSARVDREEILTLLKQS